MVTVVFQLLGGIGLFLLGMILLTDGVKALAGNALKDALVRFTGAPWKAVGSGTLVTALVQSSSATTITVIGFVSAGLLTFPQAIGVVIGASLGTTGTGWMVSILGLKVNLGFYALPLVGIGAFMKLLGPPRWSAFGTALAGFGIIFVGIGILQEAMGVLTAEVDLGRILSEGRPGHVLAVLVGIVMTVIMQSSSAAVATTLTALHAGAISLEQAASVVIGAAVGTTVTSGFAAIGGTPSAKRTAWAHILFNLATGIIAFVCLPGFLWTIGWMQRQFGLEGGAVSLAAFHTAFIGVGVVLVMPWVRQFGRGIERLVPDRSDVGFGRHLDDSLLLSPAVALEASRRALAEVAAVIFEVVEEDLGKIPADPDKRRHADIAQGLARVRTFFSRVPPTSDERLSHNRLAQIHAVDHLSRLEEHLSPPPGMRRLMTHERLLPVVRHTRRVLISAGAGLTGKSADQWVLQVEREAAELARIRRDQRPVVLEESARDGSDPHHALEVLDAIRWLDRVGYHTWRISHYLADDSAPPSEGAAGPRFPAS